MQPCDVQARGVTGTQLEILGEHEIEFIRHERLLHDFCSYIYSMKCCSSGILGMDFLQHVGAEISLTAQLLNVGRYSFPLRGREWEVSTVQRLINARSEGLTSLDQEEGESEPVGDWEGTVEVAEAVTVPPHSVRIARFSC